MAEEPRPDPSAPDKSGLPAAEHADTDWGADWESAFQAEDDTFFTTADEEFFLDEEPTQAAAPAADAALEKALAEAQPGSGGAAARPTLPSLDAGALLGKLAALPTALLALPLTLWQRLTALPIGTRVLVLALALFVPLTGITAYWLLSTPAPPPQLAGVPAASPPPGGGEAHPPAATEAPPPVPEKVRKKIALQGFLIPVRDEKSGGAMVFVQVDLTLHTLLGEEEELSPEKEAMARDIVYQFFTNHTLSELRRYQLARGELQRDLRAWLEKQWPDAPVESITFSRYQLG